MNKIAAGEVIERPASVVKELVENAIDAGALRVDVTIEDGGRQLISVTDNGCGLSADDLSLAFVPHATSKLADEESLFSINTMGFRGEALASIASISHAAIRTRKRGDANTGGCEIDASGPDVGEVRPCAASEGTTITIRDLFFNTPARRKFLRTSATESGHIAEQITRVALPHPQIAFTLTHGKRKVHNLPKCDSTRQRIADVFDSKLADSLLALSPRNAGDVSVSGLICPPSAARGSGKWQYFFLNGRYIRDRIFSHALKEAYRGLVDPNRWPVAFIFIEVPPEDVDVNVHPTKIEVRFRNSQAVHSEILATLRETLNKANLTPAAAMSRQDAHATSGDSEPMDDAHKQQVRQAMADFFKTQPQPQSRLDFSEPSTHSTSDGHAAAGKIPLPIPPTASKGPSAFSQHESAMPAAAYTHTMPPATGTPADAAGFAESAGGFELSPNAPQRTDEAAMIFQVADSYIVAGSDEGVIIVDQHALHERIIYNELKSRITSGKLVGQRLLIPATVNVTDAEAALLDTNRELLKKLAIEAEPFGPGTIAIQQFPSLLASRGVDIPDFIRKMIDTLGEDDSADPERAIESILQTMSCKAAIKAGHPLTVEEMQSLLHKRTLADKASACPHGRPTTLQLTLADLAKQFKRT